MTLDTSLVFAFVSAPLQSAVVISLPPRGLLASLPLFPQNAITLPTSGRDTGLAPSHVPGGDVALMAVLTPFNPHQLDQIISDPIVS